MSKYEFGVQMSCQSCSGAVDRALGRLEAVQSRDVSLENQTVTVDSTLPLKDIEAAIAKTGKKINYSKEL